MLFIKFQQWVFKTVLFPVAVDMETFCFFINVQFLHWALTSGDTRLAGFPRSEWLIGNSLMSSLVQGPVSLPPWCSHGEHHHEGKGFPGLLSIKFTVYKINQPTELWTASLPAWVPSFSLSGHLLLDRASQYFAFILSRPSPEPTKAPHNFHKWTTLFSGFSNPV